MIRVSVLYPSKDGGEFNIDYYRNQHLDLVRERLGDALKGSEVYKGLAGAEGAAPPFVSIGHLFFDSVEAFEEAFGAHGEAIMADIPNYTNIEPQILIDEQV